MRISGSASASPLATFSRLPRDHHVHITSFPSHSQPPPPFPLQKRNSKNRINTIRLPSVVRFFTATQFIKQMCQQNRFKIIGLAVLLTVLYGLYLVGFENKLHTDEQQTLENQEQQYIQHQDKQHHQLTLTNEQNNIDTQSTDPSPPSPSSPLLRSLISISPTTFPIENDFPILYQLTSPLIQQTARSAFDYNSSLSPLPPPSSGFIERGIVLLLHGCSHGASHWFGLPEERRIVRSLLSYGYSVLAVSSLDRESQCWQNSFSEENEDVKRVIKAVNELERRVYSGEESERKERGGMPPLFAIGASSGGTFASILARVLPLRAAVIQISLGSASAFAASSTTPSPPLPLSNFNPLILSPPSPSLYPLPSLLFLFMPRDNSWATTDRIYSTLSQLRSFHSNIDVRSLEAKEKKLTERWMWERVDELFEKGEQGKEASKMFYKLAEQLKLVSETDTIGSKRGSLLDDPRSSGMLESIHKKAEREAKEGKEGEKEKAQPLVELLGKELVYGAFEEELNLLYAQHEMTSEHLDEVIQWFHSKSNPLAGDH